MIIVLTCVGLFCVCEKHTASLGLYGDPAVPYGFPGDKACTHGVESLEIETDHGVVQAICSKNGKIWIRYDDIVQKGS